MAEPRVPHHEASAAAGTDGAALPLERGRVCYERQDWNDAFVALSAADGTAALGAQDLERLAWSAGLTARDDEMLVALERWHQAELGAGRALVAARAALWLGFRLFARGEAARAGGWLGRCQRLVDEAGQACVEQGYLLLPATQRLLNTGEFQNAHDTAARAVALGERFAEPDLQAFARNLQGRALLRLGRLDDGFALMDEALLAVISGELSPVVTGLVNCSAIAACQRIYAFERTIEWTNALDAWCGSRPQMVLFKGHCLVHRAQLLRMRGHWPQALQQARDAVQRCVGDFDREAAGLAHYEQAEVHRLRGDASAAEACYRDASRCGVEPQPGLTLLRLSQGDREAAAGAIRRVAAATGDALARTRHLPAYAEVMLAVGDIEEARAASRELDQTAHAYNTPALTALALQTWGAVQLASGNPRAAPQAVRDALSIWQQLGAPYESAQLRLLLARACLALHDAEGAQLEFDAAQESFAALGASPELAKVRDLRKAIEPGQASSASVRGLTSRELEVLRLLATGKTNKAIAQHLGLSGKTVDRHVSNIFDKLDVASRSAATAFAYEHRLV